MCASYYENLHKDKDKLFRNHASIEVWLLLEKTDKAVDDAALNLVLAKHKAIELHNYVKVIIMLN